MMARRLPVSRLFIVTVIIPTVIATFYYGFMASGVYLSESRFIVRSPQHQSSFLGDMLKNSGFSRSQDDSYTVQDFILSRDALKGLEEKLHLKESYSSNDIDIVSRFSGFSADDSNESFYRYYQNQIVDIRLDTFSSIATLIVRGYTPEQAHTINEHLLEMSEALVNRLNERGQQDLIQFANKEVEDAEKKAQEKALALEEFRNNKGVLDPEKESIIPQQEISKLEDELLTTKTQIAQLEVLAKNNPQLDSLRHHAKLLEQEIHKEISSIAGSRDHSLASKATEYRRLVMENEFSNKMLASALNSLEQARNEAQRKQQYLERIAAPSIPDKAMEPRRLRIIASVFILSLVIYGILTMLVHSIKEHQD